jgi:hypothetical protein
VIRGVATKFEPCLDVPNGGLFLSLPYLLSNGLLKDLDKYFSNVKEGFYRLDQIFLLLAMMSLARVKNPEQLRKVSPGEWGKLFGLDRIPEAKTLRDKIKAISSSSKLYNWGSNLSRLWLNSDDFSGCLYVDGHVRVYHGKQTKLPKRFVSREKLCLRSMVDYWASDTIGRPFFVISSALTSGMTKVMKEEVVPRVLNELESCPSKEELMQDADLHIFVLIYDRESYSYLFMWEMKQLRVACQTYNKFPGADWDEAVFEEKEITLAHGNKKTMKIAEEVKERTIEVDGELNRMIKIREVRVLTDSGHQTSIIGTDFISTTEDVGSHMFGRWCQENFFKYMLKDFDIDRLIDYSTQSIDETKSIKSPDYKALESVVSKEAGKLGAVQRKLGKLKVEESKLDEKKNKKRIDTIQSNMGLLLAEIALIESKLIETKNKKKVTPTHIQLKDLPEDQQFSQLASPSRFLINTIKMIAYRAETAMAIQIKDWLVEDMKPRARSILKGMYALDADIFPEKNNSKLTIRLHTSANPMLNEVVRKLCKQLNDTELEFPGTKLKLNYILNEN